MVFLVVSGFKSYTTSSLITPQYTWTAGRHTQCANVQPQPPLTPTLKFVPMQVDPATSIPTALTLYSTAAPRVSRRPLLKYDVKPPTPSYTHRTPVTNASVTLNSMSGLTLRRPASSRD